MSPGRGVTAANALTLSDVADMAEVGRSAVSNWRKRHEDFPRPVASSAHGPLFDRAEVETWLRNRHQLRRTLDPAQSLWRAIEAYRGAAPADQLVSTATAVVATCVLTGKRAQLPATDVATAVREAAREAETSHPELAGCLLPYLRSLTAEHARLVSAVWESACVADPEEVVEGLLRWRTRLVGRRTWEFATSEPLRRLLVELASPVTGVIYDPAAGEGGLLLSAWLAAREHETPVELIGQDLHNDARATSLQRLAVAGARARVSVGDTLAHDAVPDLRADIVLCDPPYGLKRSRDEGLPWDERWTFGPPTAATLDFAWLQHCYWHLARGGRAFVLMPTGTLLRGGVEAQIRAEMIRREAVEAIIALPGGLAEQTSIPLALWILHRPQGDGRPDVQLIDASQIGSRRRARTQLHDDDIVSLVTTYHRWRSGGAAETSALPVAAVSRLDLLAPGAVLVPARWTSPAVDESKIFVHLFDAASMPRLAWERLQQCDAPRYEFEAAEPRTHVATVRQLLDEGQLELRAGTRIADDELGDDPADVPVITPADLRSIDFDPSASVKEELVSSIDLTRPGDIIFQPVGPHPITVVDEQGGHLVQTPLQVLRITGPGLDPWVVAAVLTSEHNRRMAAGAMLNRVDLRSLLVPRMTQEELSALSAAIRTAIHRARAAERVARAESRAARGLAEVAMTHRLARGRTRNAAKEGS